MNIYIHKNSTGDGYAVNVRNEHGYMISQYYANDYAKAVKTRDELKAFYKDQP